MDLYIEINMIEIVDSIIKTIKLYIRKVLFYGENVKTLEKINVLMYMNELYIWLQLYKLEKGIDDEYIMEYKNQIIEYIKNNEEISIVYAAFRKMYVYLNWLYQIDEWINISNEINTEVSEDILLDHNSKFILDENNQIIKA